MSKVKFGVTTIRESEKATDDSRLFVLNRSNPAGNINFNVTDSAGQRQVIAVPLTSCPIDLSNFAEKVSILRNPDFRRLVSKAMLVLVDNDQAEEFVTRDPRGIAETRRIYGVIEGGNDPELSGEVQFAETAARTTAEAVGAGAVNPFIENIVGRSRGEEDAADLISEIDSKLHILEMADIEYVAKFAINAELKAWASTTLEEMRLEEATKPGGLGNGA